MKYLKLKLTEVEAYEDDDCLGRNNKKLIITPSQIANPHKNTHLSEGKLGELVLHVLRISYPPF